MSGALDGYLAAAVLMTMDVLMKFKQRHETLLNLTYLKYIYNLFCLSFKDGLLLIIRTDYNTRVLICVAYTLKQNFNEKFEKQFAWCLNKYVVS